MYLEVRKLSKSFGEEAVLKDISFGLEKQKTLAILGKSGSGKTTLLKILAGLEDLDLGAIYLGDQEISRWSPQRRNMVYLYQEPLLFPHLSVFENLAFGLRIRHLPQNEITEKTEHILQELSLEQHHKKKPQQLSGGQRQRVAFGRAILIEPPVLLLDEPFGALDIQTRQQMQDLFLNLVKKHRITSLFVTHDIKEALRMGDEWAAIQEGHLRVFPDKKHFVEDATTGVREEWNFWDALKKEIS